MMRITDLIKTCVQCPGGAFTPDIHTTKEFPDEVVNFVRNHPVMFNHIYPVRRRPLVVRTNSDYKYTSVAVDQVMAADGNYQVLFLGTGMILHMPRLLFHIIWKKKEMILFD